MKASALAVLMAIMPVSAFTQYTLRGTVTDETGQALIGANVYIENTFQGTIADIRGSYEISDLRKGTYRVHASYIGYEPVVNSIDLTEDTSLDFTLPRANILAEEVIITATRAGDRSPLAYSNVSGEEIRDRNMGQDIPVLLGFTPSMVTSSDAGAGVGYSSFRIRGSDMNRVNITINGIPLNDSESHGVWWVDLPDFAASVDNVQIQRGVGTSTNGGAAFGATMNFETFTRNPEPYGEINAAYGSFNTWRTSLSAGTGMLDDRFTIDMRMSKINSDGFIDRASSDLKSFAMSAAWYGEKSLLKFNLLNGSEKTYQAWWGVPSVRLESDMDGMLRYQDHYLYTPEQTLHMINSDPRTYNYYTYENQTDNYQQDHYQLFFSRELTRKLILNTGFHYTYGRGYYEQHYPGESLSDYGIDDIITAGDTITSTDLVRRKWLDNDFYGLTGSLRYVSGRVEAHLGGGWNRYDGRHFGRVIWARNAGDSEIGHEWYRNESVKRDWNAYLKVNYQAWNRLGLYGDLQYRGIIHSMEGMDDDLRDITREHHFNFINPKAGAVFRVDNRQRLAASVAVGHREPNRSNFVDADPAGPDPGAETLIDYEFSYRLNLTRLSLETNLYYMDYNDQLVLTGEINDVGAAVMKNIKDSYRTGIELTAAFMPVDPIRWDVNLTLSRNRIRNYTDYVDNWDSWGSQVASDLGETEISFSPSVIGGSRLSWDVFRQFNISLLSKMVGKQYIDNSGSEDRVLDPYFVNDLLLLYSFDMGLLEALDLRLQVNNLLNAEYETNAWVYKYYLGGQLYEMDGYFPQAGLHVMAGITLRF